jgi:hypothetical protein
VRIRVDGRDVERWFDGVCVMGTDFESESLRAAGAGRSRADVPKPHPLDELQDETAKAYPIVLTHHGRAASFRNLCVRELRGQ